MAFSTATNEHLIRSNIWSTQLKEALLDELFAQRYVDWIDFPDGDTLNIPSIGQAEVSDYVENQSVKYTAMDTGNFTFTITDYKQSGTYITEKMKQDSFYTSRLVASFVPKQHRALMKAIEVKILDTGPTSQTVSNPNTINTGIHRWVARGPAAAAVDGMIDPRDFAYARYSLAKANVPMNNLVAIVDPSSAFRLSTLTNLVNLSNNPRWEGIVKTGISTGMRYITNIYGFDVYESQNLKTVGAETITGPWGAGTSSASGVANLFFSATPDIIPFVGSLRQSPKVDSEYNKDLQREEYVTTCRYGFKTYRPENLLVVITDDSNITGA